MEIKTTKPYPILLNKLAMVVIVPCEAPDTIDEPVGSGPLPICIADETVGRPRSLFWVLGIRAGHQRGHFSVFFQMRRRGRLLWWRVPSRWGSVCRTISFWITIRRCAISAIPVSPSHSFSCFPTGRRSTIPECDWRLILLWTEMFWCLVSGITQEVLLANWWLLRSLGIRWIFRFSKLIQPVPVRFSWRLASPRDPRSNSRPERGCLSRSWWGNSRGLVSRSRFESTRGKCCINGSLLGRRRWFSWGWNAGPGDASDVFDALVHTPDPRTGYGDSNWTRFSDPILDRLIEESGASLQMNARKNLLESCMRRTLDARVYLPLYVVEEEYGIARGTRFLAAARWGRFVSPK